MGHHGVDAPHPVALERTVGLGDLARGQSGWKEIPIPAVADERPREESPVPVAGVKIAIDERLLPVAPELLQSVDLKARVEIRDVFAGRDPYLRYPAPRLAGA
jgi:hypothetical protein